MSKLIVTEFVSLNGVVEAPGGEPTHPHTGWVGDYQAPEQFQYKLDEVLEAESLLIGRKTYEGFSAAWPERAGEFAEKMNSMAKYVISATLTDPEWNNTTVLSGDVVEEVRRLKEADGGPILVAGSATLVHALVENDLVDSYRAMVFPVLIAEGLRMFGDPAVKKPMKLVDSRVFESGVTVLVYEPAGS